MQTAINLITSFCSFQSVSEICCGFQSSNVTVAVDSEKCNLPSCVNEKRSASWKLFFSRLWLMPENTVNAKRNIRRSRVKKAKQKCENSPNKRWRNGRAMSWQAQFLCSSHKTFPWLHSWAPWNMKRNKFLDCCALKFIIRPVVGHL